MTKSLYLRLGGYDAVSTFTTQLFAQAQKDDLLGRFWKNDIEDRDVRDLQMLINYLVNQAGG